MTVGVVTTTGLLVVGTTWLVFVWDNIVTGVTPVADTVFRPILTDGWFILTTALEVSG